ncbi:MAG: hypothetical protein RIG68_09795 [Imperialibacter sp.]|uniref:hypothetical protein n=1 Tax=Imperialibacter sp. TaxID=2038411 RepID=UPI0032EE137A
MDSITLSGLSSVFRTLKFENGPCNSRWGSDLQLVMEALGKQLGVKGTPYGEVFKRIGPPDEQSDASEIVKLLPGESILIYYWRGRHDFLYFITENKVIKRSDWWYAYE